MEKDLSRRNFIKGSLVAGVGTSALFLAPQTQAFAQGAEDRLVVDSEGVAWDQEYDIVIVGSGYAGVAAATDVGRAGLSAVILEANNVAGGNSIMCGGGLQAGGGNSIQVAAGIEDTPERFFNDMFQYGYRRAERPLMQKYVDNCTEDVVNWLMDIGMEFSPNVGAQEGHSINVQLMPALSDRYPGAGGISHWNVINDEAINQGVETLLEHEATKLVQRASDGAILGVQVNAKGTIQYFKAKKAVILASGGFKSNTAMLRNWEPRIDSDISAGGEPYLTQCQAIMSEAAVACGAAQRDMSFVCEYRFKWGTRYYQHWDPVDISNPPVLTTGLAVGDFTNLMIVNGSGERFCNEEEAGEYPQDPFYDAFLTLQERPRRVWVIADATIAEANRWNLDAIAAPDESSPPCLAPDYVAIADTIEELAGKMGIDAAALKAEVDKYNGFVDAGEDEDFGKEGLEMKLETGPFYALRVTFFAHDQQAGLTVNTKAQVVSRASLFGESKAIDDRPIIPHLYACGESAGGYYGQARGHGKIGVCMYWGRVAGREAAKESNVD